MTTPAAILAAAMKLYGSGRAFADLIARAGVPKASAWRARAGAHGRPTRAEHHLKLCMVMGIDPVDGHAISPRPPAPIITAFFACAVKGNRFLKGHSIRQAAKEMGISGTSLSRIENGDVRSFDTMWAACRYVGGHPFDYVTRETSSETKMAQRDAA